MKKNDEQVDKVLKQIEHLSELQEKLARHFTIKCARLINQRHISEALFIRLADKYNFHWQGDLWDFEIDYEEALKLLSDFDFEILDKELLSETTILPKRLLMQYKVQIKSKGLIWIIHKYDKDPFPSNPHAHQLDNNIKLDLSNGRCYKTKKYVYTISKKNLLDIRKKAEEIFHGTLPKLTV